MDSSMIMMKNLMNHYKINSIRALAKKMGCSEFIMLNWSSGRSSPSIEQVNSIAYQLGVEATQLLILDNTFSLETPIWRDKVDVTLKNNLGRLRLEKDIHERFFYEDVTDQYMLSYKSFLRYVNGRNKKVNLSALDKLAHILSIEPYKLLESEKRK